MQTRPETPDMDMNGRGDPFNAPVPGQSLTTEQGDMPFEKAPKIVDPEELYTKLTKKFSSTDIKEKTLDTLASGIPLEVIINIMTKQLAHTGVITPDLAEGIKPSLTVFFVNMAKEEGVDIKIFLEDPEAEAQAMEGREDMLLETLASQRPEVASELKGEQFRNDIEGRAIEAQKAVAARREIDQRIEDSPMESDGSFLEMGEV
tara:strand:- start:571 stop:1182 length:612 start_codon:yes stop_codon:yes gene_type:complete